MTSGGIYRTIFSTAWPMIVAFALHSAFNIVDAYFVGKISAEALAAVSISFPIAFLFISLATGIGVGTTSLIARHVGAQQFGKAGEVAEHSLILGFISALVLAIIGIVSSPYLFALMGVAEDVSILALDYIYIILAGSPFLFMAMVGNSIIRGEGEMKVPMYVMGSASILNIILDPIFIFTLGWGVKGAAWATLLSRFVAVAITVAYFYSDKTWIKLKFRKFRFNMEYIKDILKVGFPSSLSNLSMSIGIFLWTALVAGFGTEAVAAFGIGFRLDSLALLPAIGISTAVVSLVGQNVGANKYDRAQDITFKAGYFATALMMVFGVIFLVFPEQLISVFNTDPLVVSHGVTFLKIVPLTYLVVGFSITIAGAFLGSGHALPSLAINILRVIVLSVPMAYAFSQSMGVEGVWWGITGSTYIASVVAVIWFRKGTWKKKSQQTTGLL